MDVDYYYPAKHQQININDDCAEEGNDGDEASTALFPCPFCYVQVQVNLLCTHLQNDHSFDFINIAVCPLCAANLGKDGTAHFISQHTSLLKKRRRKEELWSASPNLETHDLCDPAPDPLLSPFLCTPTFPQQQIHPKRASESPIQEDNDYETTRHKSMFVQGLVSSTILSYLGHT